MGASGKRIYRFEDIEVDTSQNCIRRNGEQYFLRQKTFQVLVCLLDQRHRLVSKEELAENVWTGTAVSDDTLVQCVVDIRKVLGDNPRQPRFVKTIPKSGYRFIADAQEQWVNGSSVFGAEEVTTLQVEFEEVISDEPFPVTTSSSRPLLARIVSKGALLVLVTFVGLVAAAVIFFVGLKKDSTTTAAEPTLPQVAGGKTVAVIFFQNQSATAELDWLREGLADMVITGLSRSRKISVLSRQQLSVLFERTGRKRGARIELEDALDIARRSRAETIVMGSFASLGETIRVEAQVLDAQTGQLLAAESIVAGKQDQILNQIDLLSVKLASHIAPTGSEPSAVPDLSGVMTKNLQAYRYYSLALEKAETAHRKDAIELLKKAVALDPEFAMAHARIGYVYAVAWNFAEKAKPHLEKAYQLTHRLTEKDRLYIRAWYQVANHDYDGAIRDFQQIIAEFPMDIEAAHRLGRLLMGEDRAEEAIDVFKRGLVADPESTRIYNSLGGAYIVLGRHDDAIASHQRYVQLAPSEPDAYDSLGLSYQWAGRYDEAVQQYTHAIALDPGFDVARVHLANLHFQQGRYREAIREYRRYIEVAPSDRERARGYALIAYVHLQKGELDLSAKAVAQAERLSELPSWVYLTLALARGDNQKVEKLKRQLWTESSHSNKNSTAAILRYSLYHRGYIDLKEGRQAEALENFRQSLRHNPTFWDVDSFEDCLANGYLELGRFDEAIAEYQRILKLNPNYPLAHYHLAQALERKGEGRRARDEYENFLKVWSTADEDIPKLIDAQARLNELK